MDTGKPSDCLIVAFPQLTIYGRLWNDLSQSFGDVAFVPIRAVGPSEHISWEFGNCFIHSDYQYWIRSCPAQGALTCSPVTLWAPISTKWSQKRSRKWSQDQPNHLLSLRFLGNSRCDVVPRRGLEPPLPCENWHLKPARLPIPPSGRNHIVWAEYAC